MSSEDEAQQQQQTNEQLQQQEETATATSQGKEKSKGKHGYHYWHNHEKQRAAIGDVAPKTTPQSVKKEAVQGSPIVVRDVEITKYSWCNNEKSVSVYVDFEGVGAIAEADASHVSVDFKKQSMKLTVVKNGVNNALLLNLSKEIVPEDSSLRMKPAQIVLKLSKKDKDQTWYDLTTKVVNDKDE